jgi:hypothetical protein
VTALAALVIGLWMQCALGAWVYRAGALSLLRQVFTGCPLRISCVQACAVC